MLDTECLEYMSVVLFSSGVVFHENNLTFDLCNIFQSTTNSLFSSYDGCFPSGIISELQTGNIMLPWMFSCFLEYQMMLYSCPEMVQPYDYHLDSIQSAS